MKTTFIEGYLQLKIDGHWYVDDYKIKEGTLFEILQNHKWVMVSMECSQGAFYCIPLIPLSTNDKVRIELSHE